MKIFPYHEYVPVPIASDVDRIIDSDNASKIESLNVQRLYFQLLSLSKSMDFRPYDGVVRDNSICWFLMSMVSFCYIGIRSISFSGFFCVLLRILTVVFFYGFIFIEVKLWRKIDSLEPHDETEYHFSVQALEEADSIKSLPYFPSLEEFYTYWNTQYYAYSMLESVRKESINKLRIAKSYGSLLIVVLFVFSALINSYIPDRSGYDSGYDDGYSEGYDIGYDNGFDDAFYNLSDYESSYEAELTREGLPNPNTVVYVTSTGNKYHLDGCTYLGDSQIETTLAKARAEGYSPCSVCNPPS